LPTSHAEPRAPSCASTNVMTDPVSGDKHNCGLVWPVVYTVVAVCTDVHVCTYVCSVLNTCKAAGYHSSGGEATGVQRTSNHKDLAARNILLSKELSCKVSALATTDYVYYKPR